MSKVPRRVERRRQHRQRGDDLRQVARLVALEDVAHRVRPVGDHVDHIAQRQAILRMPLLLERLEREHDVVRRHRRAVGELGLGPQVERDRQAVGRPHRRARDQAVDGIRLVVGAHHQAVEQQRQALRGVALQDEGVEAVERQRRAGAHLRDAPALRRVRIDVVEMLEVRRILQVAEGRDAVPLDAVGGAAMAVCRSKSKGGTRPGPQSAIEMLAKTQAASLAARLRQLLGRRLVVPPHPLEAARP